MRKELNEIMMKYSSLLCALTLVIAPIVSERCRTFFYEPEEPEGLEDFLKMQQNGRK